jgi:GTPase SAR1 family protein
LQYGDDDVNVVLVGNKVDLESKRKVPTAEGRDLAKEFGVEFFEVSARKDTNVTEAFRCLAEKALDSVMAAGPAHSDGVDIDGGAGGDGKKRCC